MTIGLISDIVAFFSLLVKTISVLGRVVTSISGLRSFEIDRLIEEIAIGNLNYGDKVTVSGIFSDFLPITRKLMIPVEDANALVDILPCKPFSINGNYCAALQSFSSKFVSDPNALPIFYKDNTPRPIIQPLSGLSVEIKGTLMSIPSTWSRLLDSKKPICINADSMEMIGAERVTFGTNIWAIVESRKAFLKPFEGRILSGESFWWYTNRMGASNRYLFMNGGVHKRRHGNVNEKFDTICDFYGINILDEQEYEMGKSALEAKTRHRKIIGQYDMAVVPVEQTEWLRKKIGLART
jgi:hypothetical protein